MSVVIPFGIVYTGRSREGAWIEIPQSPTLLLSTATVAPVRERGLKFLDTFRCYMCQSRSREGAWIEIGRSCRQAAI